MKKSGGKAVRYNKWGYIFLIPFIVVYVVFQLVPLITTIYNSFFENYMSGLTQVGPNFVGFENYEKLKYWLYQEDIYEEMIKDPYFAEYKPEQCQQDLAMLVEWRDFKKSRISSRFH